MYPWLLSKHTLSRTKFVRCPFAAVVPTEAPSSDTLTVGSSVSSDSTVLSRTQPDTSCLPLLPREKRRGVLVPAASAGFRLAKAAKIRHSWWGTILGRSQTSGLEHASRLARQAWTATARALLALRLGGLPRCTSSFWPFCISFWPLCILGAPSIEHPPVLHPHPHPRQHQHDQPR